MDRCDRTMYVRIPEPGPATCVAQLHDSRHGTASAGATPAPPFRDFFGVDAAHIVDAARQVLTSRGVEPVLDTPAHFKQDKARSGHRALGRRDDEGLEARLTESGLSAGSRPLPVHMSASGRECEVSPEFAESSPTAGEARDAKDSLPAWLRYITLAGLFR